MVADYPRYSGYSSTLPPTAPPLAYQPPPVCPPPVCPPPVVTAYPRPPPPMPYQMGGVLESQSRGVFMSPGYPQYR